MTLRTPFDDHEPAIGDAYELLLGAHVAGRPVVGGPVEIATITKHEGFKWVSDLRLADDSGPALCPRINKANEAIESGRVVQKDLRKAIETINKKQGLPARKTA